MSTKVETGFQSLNLTNDTIFSNSDFKNITLEKIDSSEETLQHDNTVQIFTEVLPELQCHEVKKDDSLERIKESNEIMKLTEKINDMKIVAETTEEEKISINDEYILKVKKHDSTKNAGGVEFEKEGSEHDETSFLYSVPNTDTGQPHKTETHKNDHFEKSEDTSYENKKLIKTNCENNTHKNDAKNYDSMLMDKIKDLDISNQKLIPRGPDKNHKNKYIPQNTPYPLQHYSTASLDVLDTKQLSRGKMMQQYFPSCIMSDGLDLTNIQLCGNNILKDDDDGYGTASPSQSSPQQNIPTSPSEMVNSFSPSDHNEILEPAVYGLLSNNKCSLTKSFLPNYTNTNETFDEVCSFSNINKSSTTLTDEHFPENLFEDLESLIMDYSHRKKNYFSLINEAAYSSNSSLNYIVNEPNSKQFNMSSNVNIPSQQTVIPVKYCYSPKVPSYNLQLCPNLPPITSDKIRPIQPKVSSYPLKLQHQNPTESLLSGYSEADVKNCWFNISILSKEKLFAQDHDGDTILHIAVCQKNLLMVYTIVQFYHRYNERQKIDCQNLDGQTPLYLASITNQPLVIAFLMLNGADVNVQLYKSKESISPLHVAACRGEIFLRTLEQLCYSPNVNMNIKNAQGYTPLLCAIKNHGQIMRCDYESNTFARVDSFETVAFLLHRKADPSLKEPKEGKNALHFAAESGDCKMIQVFINCYANIRSIINSLNNNDETPLHCAARLKNIQVGDLIQLLRKLLECGADPSLLNKDKKKASQLVNSSNRDVINFLEGKGCSRLQAL